jgi:opacity protein-like surface antigen
VDRAGRRGADLSSQTRNLESGQSSGGGFALALEWRFSYGFALGVEYFDYQHAYTPPAENPPFLPSNGEASVSIKALTLRKYFGEPGGIFYPYVGLGYGTADIETSHPLFGAPPVYDYESDSYSATAYLVSAGLEMRFFPTKKRHLGVVIEAKHMGYDTIGENRYDPTAMGIFVGVGLVRD